jgi:hypothetical protein
MRSQDGFGSPLPRWGEGKLSLLSFSGDGEVRHYILRSSVIALSRSLILKKEMGVQVIALGRTCCK